MKSHALFSTAGLPALCCLLLLCSIHAQVNQPPVPVPVPVPGKVKQAPAVPVAIPIQAQGSKGKIIVQFPSAPVREVMDAYQQLTGKRIIRDPAIEQATVSIETPGLLTKEEAIDFIEKSLLISGYAIVPSGEGMVKVLAFASRKPSSEGVPLITRASDLPHTDTVVSFVLQLENLKSDDAAQAFQKIIPLHQGYGDITPVPNTRALVITENSNTIRAIIEMAGPLDMPPAEVAHKNFQLERASADEVIEALNTLLGLSGGTSGGGSKKNKQQRPGTTPQPNNPQQSAALAAAQISYSTPGESDAEPPKLQAIARTNSILAIARPIDLVYIEKLIRELDAPSTVKGFISYNLKYLDASDFLNIAKDALERNGDGTGSSGTGTSSGGTNGQTNSTTRPVNSQDTSSGNGSSNGRSGSSGRGGGGGAGSSISLQEQQQAKPLSVRVGRSLLIAEPSRGEIFVSGPPEHLRIVQELIEQLDKRPQQISLTIIIGSFTLTDNFQLGLDWVNTLQNTKIAGKPSLIGGTLQTNPTASTAARDISTLGGVSSFLPALQGLTVYGQIGKNLNGFLTTLESTNHFHVLQRPVIMTLNHKLATISTGTDLAIPGSSYPTNYGTPSGTGTGTTNNTNFVSNTEYIPTGISVGVIPHIYNNNEVRLELQQKNSDIASYATISGNQVPNISNQNLQNTLIVPDQTTVLLGGLITERITNNKSGLPFLSRIPLLKYLAGSTTKNKERDELLIFVQPHIMPSAESITETQMDTTSRTEHYEETRKFYREGPAPNPLLPLPLTDPEPANAKPASLDNPPAGLPKLELHKKPNLAK